MSSTADQDPAFPRIPAIASVARMSTAICALVTAVGVYRMNHWLLFPGLLGLGNSMLVLSYCFFDNRRAFEPKNLVEAFLHPILMMVHLPVEISNSVRRLFFLIGALVLFNAG